MVAREKIRLRVSPGASSTRWLGRMADGRLKVRIAAPAEAGKANAVLMDFVARSLGIRKSAVRLVAGGSSRDKIIEVNAPADAVRRLANGERGTP